MKPNYVLEWFRFADTDLDFAEHGLKMYPPPYELICYHCQQSAEKYLKGYLFHKGIKPPKVHELDRLCAMCSEWDTRFDEINKQCSVLTAYGIQSRYPHEVEVDAYIMQKALDYTRQIKAFEPLTIVRQQLEKVLCGADEPPEDD